jgi:hypothetical protein
MSTYSDISDDYKMFETKATVDYYDSITNHVSVEEMMKHMFDVLAEYDRCLSKKQDAKVNPMAGRVIMRVSNGTTFEIPENIQKLAIARYLEITGDKKKSTKYRDKKNKKTAKKEGSEVLEGFEGFEGIEAFEGIEHMDGGEVNQDVDDANDDDNNEGDDEDGEVEGTYVSDDTTIDNDPDNNENENVAEQFTVDMDKIKRLMPKTDTRADRLKTVIIVILLLVALYSAFRFYDDYKKKNSNF